MYASLKKSYCTLLQIFPIRQSFFYVVVGSCAAMVQIGLAAVFVELLKFDPIKANCVSYFFSFFVSFFGHRYITFKATQEKNQHIMMRFLLLSLLNFALNQAGFYFLFRMLHWHYILAMIVNIGVVTIITFMLNKFSVFKS